MIETKPRINRGNRGQLFRATWLSSARCSETFINAGRLAAFDIQRIWGENERQHHWLFYTLRF